ncbi:MAG: fumarylacetoacetate hydrolase family protein [Deltaproteobacteria bacterium]
MKIVRFKTGDGQSRVGALKDALALEIAGDVFGRYEITDASYHISQIEFLPPCLPSKIVAVGLNYRDHAEEMKKALPDEPLLFLKPPSAAIGHEGKIVYPSHMSSRVDYEGELAVVISREARWVNESEALGYVLGYTCINDITARDLQSKDVQYTRAKGFDTFAPMGPCIETEIDPGNLGITTALNGEIRQRSRTSNLIFSVPRLIAFISRVMTLLPGDVISTGTPSGIGSMKSGDTVEVQIEGIGLLRNRVE